MLLNLSKTEQEMEQPIVEESYRRMENPGCHEVDASPSKEEVLRTVLHFIRKHCSSQ
uniref:Uncharacterized protein n=1 Tax=Sphenodon punctatus TaxID=8508 RepID=A0A8D0GUC3_SPHPU